VRGALVLASASPRRQELLRACGFELIVAPADLDESPLPGETPRALVARLAAAKAATIGAGVAADAIVVAADTAVVVDGHDLGKPRDDEDARRMLRTLSGRPHDVLTGYCVRRGATSLVDVVSTEVTFRVLADNDIDAWLSLGQHKDKAGAYAIQGAAAALIKTVRGSLTNVVGLPVDEVLAAIAALRTETP